MTARDKAIKELLGRVPSRRFNPRSVLAQLTETFPGEMHVIAEHLAHRIDESGGEECPAGRRLAVTVEAELLALRNVLLGRIIKEGVLTAKGDEHKHLRTVLRITDQVSRMINILGLDPPPKTNTSINVSELWRDAIQGDEDATEGDEGDGQGENIEMSKDADSGPPGQLEGSASDEGTE